MTDMNPTTADTNATPGSAGEALSDAPAHRGMFAWFGDLAIGTRIAIVVIVPVIACIGLSAHLITEKRHVMSETEQLVDLAAFAQVVGAFVHEVQGERGISIGYIASGGKTMNNELSAARKALDVELAQVRDWFGRIDGFGFGRRLQGPIGEFRTAVDTLAPVREEVSNNRITTGEVARIYTALVESAVEILERTIPLTTTPELRSAATAFVALVLAKEQAGLERAAGVSGFGGYEFSTLALHTLIRTVSAQNAYFDVFRDHITPSQRAYYEQIVAEPAAKEAVRMRNVGLESIHTGSNDGITIEGWFQAATARLDLLKQLEDRIVSDLAADARSLVAGARKEFFVITGLAIAVIGLTVVFAFFVVRAISGPLGRLTGATQQLASGDLDAAIEDRASRDEIGRLLAAVRVFKANLIENRRLQTEQREAEKRAMEEQRKREQEEREREQREAEERERVAAEQVARAERVDAMIEAFNKEVSIALESVSSAAQEMRATAESMASTAEHTSSQSSAVAAASEQAATNVQTVATAAEELAASVQEVGRQVEESARIAGTAVGEAEDTNTKVQGLAEAAQKIGEVVDLINDIASQTNLLALNATIEAARAGDAGKGFAVVASEVKSLATQTAKATEEIAGQIAAIQGATGEAVAAIGSISQTIAQVNEIASSIASAVEEQGTATREIASNVQQAAQGTQEITQNIGRVSTAATETGSASTQVLSAAEDLARQGEALKTRIASFIDEVRAA